MRMRQMRHFVHQNQDNLARMGSDGLVGESRYLFGAANSCFIAWAFL
jgi:hypothetical protein